MALYAIYGGAFDPVHSGHLAVACHARDVLDADIALVPTGDPRHRAPAHANAAQRVAMLDLAIAHQPRLRIDTRELQRNGPSFTVDTLAELRAERGSQAPLAMIVGADAFAGLPGWQRWRELFGLAHIVVASRPHPAPRPATLEAEIAGRQCREPARLHQQPAGLVLELAPGDWPQSSSDVRQRRADGLTLAGWVPDAVADYIARHGLYRRES